MHRARARGAPGCDRRTSARTRSGSRFRSSHARTSAPLRGLSDQLVAIDAERSALDRAVAEQRRGWKIAGSGALRITTGLRGSSPSSRCFSRLYRDWRIVASASSVELHHETVGAVVEAPVRADRPVDPMDHPDVGPGEPPQPGRLEVERVVEAGRRAARDPVQLDLEPTPLRARRASARRNWCPPPAGGGANSWNSARSARPSRRPPQVELGLTANDDAPPRTPGCRSARSAPVREPSRGRSAARLLAQRELADRLEPRREPFDGGALHGGGARALPERLGRLGSRREGHGRPPRAQSGRQEGRAARSRRHGASPTRGPGCARGRPGGRRPRPGASRSAPRAGRRP